MAGIYERSTRGSADAEYAAVLGMNQGGVFFSDLCCNLAVVLGKFVQGFCWLLLLPGC